jgi:hypothetical protein
VVATESAAAGVQRGQTARCRGERALADGLRNVKQIRQADGGFDERRYGFMG